MKQCLTIHIASIYEGKKPYMCTVCDFKCSVKDNLTKHIASVHEGRKPFKCLICVFKCSEKGKLNKHIASVHEGKKPYKCTVRDYKCSARGNLNIHMLQFMRARDHLSVSFAITSFQQNRVWLNILHQFRSIVDTTSYFALSYLHIFCLPPLFLYRDWTLWKPVNSFSPLWHFFANLATFYHFW